MSVEPVNAEPLQFNDEAITPPGWPRTDRPLNIAFLGWAWLPLREREGSGYNLAAAELAVGLAMSGHKVSLLRSGMEYCFRPWMFIRKRDRWRGIECYQLFNSPNLAPALFNFRNMRRERRCARQTRKVLAWLDRVGAQIVHIHSLEGFSLDLINAIEATGRRVIVTPHNYWYICPQVDLLVGGKSVCLDYQGGRACSTCLEPALPWKTRWRRAITQVVIRRCGPLLGAWWSRILFEPWSIFTSRAEKARRRKREQELIDPELARGMSVLPGDSGEIFADVPLDPSVKITELGRSPFDQNERFLAADHHLTVLNDYGRRRTEGAQALGSATLVTPPSRFCADVYARMGVPPERIRVVPLGLPHLDRLARRARRSPYYALRPWDPATARRPLRFAFFGTTRHNKGLEILTRAIPLLAPEVRQRSHFMIRAALGDWMHRRRLSRYPEVSFLGGYDMGQLLTAQGEFDVGILPHVWFENSPIVMLEYLASGKFIIASRLGGPPEWIVEPGTPGAAPNGGLGNGMLFPGGAPEDLAAAITRAVRGEVVIPSPREIHAVSRLQSYPQHVAEFEDIYRTSSDQHDATQRQSAPLQPDAVHLPGLERKGLSVTH